MICPDCHSDNREGAKFCKSCGAKLELACPSCGHPYEAGSRFCDECGNTLIREPVEEAAAEGLDGERKYVTVLFSDMSGYTAMSEKLDPEEVKEITSRVFEGISGIVAKYDGFIEKFIGDAVMALFGVPTAHEDDPIRAVRAAREIHELAEQTSPEVEDKIGTPLSMHSGIYTGLVVTGEVDVARGTHGVTGDALNVASRLSSLAGANEILVGQDTFRHAFGHFEFEVQEPVQVKGKTKPLLAYKVISPKEEPLHRLSILRAELVGRRAELAELREAVEDLKKGKGSIFSISGEAGTGKSRLVEELKRGLNLDEIQWVEGHAYPYCQNIPYFPFIDLLNRILHIEEEDHVDRVREKVESGLRPLLVNQENLIPYIGGLYSIRYPETESVSPEFWKAKLQETATTVLSSLARKAPTVFSLEDLHWADPSFLDLLRNTLLAVRQPALVLCLYRPALSLFTAHQLSGLQEIYREIQLRDLSPSDTQDMLASLLKTEQIPSDLKRLVQDKAEGNPLFLEELINSLVESEALVRENGTWRLRGSIQKSDISFTIHGIIAGRLDRLERESKRVLQEASVIGRSFLYEILKRVSELKQDLDQYLRSLEQVDLIRTKAFQPDLEYIFKHALTQEVVYNGLLKKERLDIHERIANVIEQVFQDRLPEFYETLAFHFKRGRSEQKAVHFLIRSGEKSLARYSVKEAHHYFQDAYEILKGKGDRTGDEDTLLIDLIIKWAYVYYYRGDFKGLTGLLGEHMPLADSLADKSLTGMFHGWLGMAVWARERYKESYEHLQKALEIGEEIGNQIVIGYACTWLTWTCAELGFLDEALQHGKKAQRIAAEIPSDHYLYFKSLGGIGFTHWYRGEGSPALEAGKAMAEFGEQHSDIRSMVMGHYVQGLGHYALGDIEAGIDCQRRAVEISADPYYRQFPMLLLGAGRLWNRQLDEACDPLEEVAAFSRVYGTEALESPAILSLGGVHLYMGELKKGLGLVKEANRRFQESERKVCIVLADLNLARFYSRVATGGGETSPAFLIKNIGFLMTQVPFAGRRAEEHFANSIALATEIGALGYVALGNLELGMLHAAKGRKEDAEDELQKAVQIFEQIQSPIYLQQAKEALESLNG